MEAIPPITDQGYLPDQEIQQLYLTVKNYPEYIRYMSEQCRPLGTTLLTFTDFNLEQINIDPLPPNRTERIIKHVTGIGDAKPFMPLLYVDVYDTGTSLSIRT